MPANRLFWGDIHNHCSVSYGKGTAERALANAREHLDFCSITGHAFWPDMPMDLAQYDRIIAMHLGGFAKLQYYWQDLLKAQREACRDGSFVTLPSYEWHSMKYGDHNCYFNSDDAPLMDAASPDALWHKLRDAGHDVMLLPHHIGYTRGHRGLNWEHFNADRSPLIEIYSNHGASEADDAPYEYHHSMGPRVAMSMARAGLQAGHKVGFYASTDSHDGYPGHYGHGRVGVLAPRLDRQSLWEALKARRTIASTGARIHIDEQLADAGIGQVTRRRDALPLRLEVEGTSAIARVDLVTGGPGRWQVQPLGGATLHNHFEPGRYRIRVEAGWGHPPEQSQWQLQAQIHEGEIIAATPYFRYGGYSNQQQQPSDRILSVDAHQACWECHALPNPSGQMGGTHFDAGGTQSVVLEVQARANTQLTVQHAQQKLVASVPQLLEGSITQPAAGFGSAAFKVHRAIGQREYRLSFEHCVVPGDQAWGYVYPRVLQVDGQVAWASPIWYE